MEQLVKKSLYELEVYQDTLNRLDALTAESKAAWGGMNAAQMLAHCAEVLEVANGKPLEGTPWFVKLLSGFVKKMVISAKPYPKSTGTHPQYVVSDAREFETEKNRLLAAIEAFVSEDKSDGAQRRHPVLGLMTPDERGWAMCKHVDHHLSQFGA